MNRKQRRLKKKFLHQEKSRLQKRIFRLRIIINEALEDLFDRRLYNLKKEDEFRLLTLYTWRDRYQVPVKWILKQLLPIWNKRFARFKIKASLGCRVATLVGKKSEEIIRERIWREYPNGENRENYEDQERSRIIRSLDSKSSSKKSTKYKSILEAPNAKTFIKQYKRELKWNKQSMSNKSKKQLEAIKQKQFRNNPFQ